jgi:hypothetical protein
MTDTHNAPNVCAHCVARNHARCYALACECKSNARHPMRGTEVGAALRAGTPLPRATRVARTATDDARAVFGDRGSWRAHAYAWDHKRAAYNLTPLRATLRILARGVPNTPTPRTRMRDVCATCRSGGACAYAGSCYRRAPMRTGVVLTHVGLGL